VRSLIDRRYRFADLPAAIAYLGTRPRPGQDGRGDDVRPTGIVNAVQR